MHKLIFTQLQITFRVENHGRKSRGGMGTRPPPEFGVGDANANYPPDFVMFQNFYYQIGCITFTPAEARDQIRVAA